MESDFLLLETLGKLGVLSFLKIITRYTCVYAYFFVPLCAKFVCKQNTENYEENLHAHHKRLVRALHHTRGSYSTRGGADC